ncbi:hypothetical protein [Microvirga yunnanensis]|uniref:hypothetical protein n=1 Tax=Microvirga yunnanensis TaxID=2953740 RepID=UPI0021C639BC|nr:hypothetical protein [Microvirga sp. HBU65207]
MDKLISNVEETWVNPSAARWLERLGRFARLIAQLGQMALVEVQGCDVFTFQDGKIAVKNSYRKQRTG